VDLIEQSLKFIAASGRYCTAQEVRQALNVDLALLYKTEGLSIPKLNAQCGFFRTTKIEKDMYETRILDYIRQQGRFVSSLEIANTLGISRSTFKLRNMCIDNLNEQLGFSRGYAKSVVTHNKLGSEYIDTIRQRMKNQLLLGYVPENTMYKILGLKRGALPSYIDYQALVEESGIEHQGFKRFGSTTEMAKKCIEIIVNRKRYCSNKFLANELEVTPNLFRSRGIDTVELNNRCGYFRDNGCFEAEVGEVLRSMYPDSKVISQKWFADLRSDLGNVLYFDYYIEDKRIAVEADGPCHTDPSHPWYTERGLHRDSLKNEYCQNNNITLVRVPYSTLITVDYVKSCYPGSPLEPSITTTELETADVMVQENTGLGNQQGSFLGVSQEEPSTIIPLGSRVQEDSKRTDDE